MIEITKWKIGDKMATLSDNQLAECPDQLLGLPKLLGLRFQVIHLASQMLAFSQSQKYRHPVSRYKKYLGKVRQGLFQRLLGINIKPPSLMILQLKSLKKR